MTGMTRRRFMVDTARISAALGVALALPQKSFAYSSLPTKYIISSDSQYFYHVDKNFLNTQAPIHRNKVIPSAHINGPLDTVIIDPFKGPEYLWATTEFLSNANAPVPRQVYSFNVFNGVVSNVQSYDISHLVPAINQLESMCIDPQNRKIILADNPNYLYILDENFGLLNPPIAIDLGALGYNSPQGVCYVPWLDGYLITDNVQDKMLVINEAGEILWEIHPDRLNPIPTNPQGVAVDYATRDILQTYYQPSDGVAIMNWGGIQKAAYVNTLWEPTITYANPVSIAVVQEPFTYAAID